MIVLTHAMKLLARYYVPRMKTISKIMNGKGVWRSRYVCKDQKISLVSGVPIIQFVRLYAASNHATKHSAMEALMKGGVSGKIFVYHAKPISLEISVLVCAHQFVQMTKYFVTDQILLNGREGRVVVARTSVSKKELVYLVSHVLEHVQFTVPLAKD